MDEVKPVAYLVSTSTQHFKEIWLTDIKFFKNVPRLWDEFRSSVSSQREWERKAKALAGRGKDDKEEGKGLPKMPHCHQSCAETPEAFAACSLFFFFFGVTWTHPEILPQPTPGHWVHKWSRIEAQECWTHYMSPGSLGPLHYHCSFNKTGPKRAKKTDW